MNLTNADRAVEWLHSRRYAGKKSGLDNTRVLLSRLGNPERSFRCVHIAGTNGKGSTSAMLESMLRALGYKTGLYTSPFLMHYNERIRFMGNCIPDDALLEGVNLLYDACLDLDKEGLYFPTTFELGTALAFWYFRKVGADVAVVEVGLGGRFDSTNVITPDVSLIAAIGMDHMAYLGDTLSAIAFEKAGIIKPGVPVCVQDQADEVLSVFRTTALERSAPLFVVPEARPIDLGMYENRFSLENWGELTVPLPGAHQLKNASLALCGLQTLLGQDYFTPERIETAKAGLQKTVWPGRLEWVERSILLDGAHNPQGANTLADYLKTHFPGKKPVLVTCMMQDKQVEECSAIFAPLFSRVFATQIDDPRCVPAETLKNVYLSLGTEAEAVGDPEQALSVARAHDPEGVVVVAGSLYLVGAIRKMLTKGGE